MQNDLKFKAIALSASGGKGNDDATGGTDHAVWVIDGATGLTAKRQLPGTSDAAWLAKKIHSFMHSVQPPIDPGEVMSGLADYVETEFEQERSAAKAKDAIEAPSAALSFAALAGDKILLGNIGDCRALIKLPAEPLIVFGSSPNNLIEEKLIAALVARQQDNDKPMSELWQDMLPDIQVARSFVNRDADQGGYGVIDPSPRWLAHMQFKSIPVTPGTRLLLMSDGLERLVDFNRYTFETLFAAAWDNGLQVLVEEVRTIEESDPECRVFPRMKPMDDASAVLAEIVPKKLSGPSL